MEAGACLAGGHTIDDDTLKFGLSVSGFADSSAIWTNAGAKAGDALILTKALGTGTITSALKRKEVEEKFVRSAILSMTQLNRAPELLEGEKIHAATDITGFGLAGHALQMARASGVSFEIDTKALPVLEGAEMCLEKGILNRAHKTNWDYVRGEVDVTVVSDAVKWLTVDPQTSGGLLLAVPSGSVNQVLKKLHPRFEKAVVIGRVVPNTPDSAKIHFR